MNWLRRRLATGSPGPDDHDEIGRQELDGLWVKFPWGWDWWRPLFNDGDALRLAVKLRMVIDTDYNGGSIAGNSKIECNYEEPEFGYQEGMGKKDPYAATRRAIVRAAAKIGRKSNDF